jgi:hypothetical protein
MYALARYFGCRPQAAAASAIVYGCSGWFAQHVGGGHWGFAAVSLFPFVVLFLLRSEKSPWFMVPAVALGVWVAVHWGIYPLPWLFMLTLLVTAAEFVRTKRSAIWRRFALFVLFTLSLAAARLIPVAEYVSRFPRGVAISDRLSPADILHVFLGHQANRDVVGHPYEWPEYGNYIGWMTLALLVLGCKMRFPRKKMLWSGVVVFIALTLGSWGSGSPFALLHGLPLFENLRVPSRYTLLVVFFFALIAGLALSSLLDACARRWDGPRANATRHLVGLGVVLAIACDAIATNRGEFRQSFHLAPPTDDVSDSFVQRRGDPLRMFAYPRANQGSVRGLEESPIPRAAGIWIDGGDQHRLTNQGSARATYWSPNVLRYSIETDVPNAIVINQNYRPEWRASGDAVIAETNGLLTVLVPPGHHELQLEYSPNRMGTLVSLVGIPVLLLWAHQTRRRTSRDGEDVRT